MDNFALRCKKMPSRLRGFDAYKRLQTQINDFQIVLPLLQELSKASIMPRHWDEVKELTGMEFDQTGAEFKLQTVAAGARHFGAGESAREARGGTGDGRSAAARPGGPPSSAVPPMASGPSPWAPSGRGATRDPTPRPPVRRETRARPEIGRAPVQRSPPIRAFAPPRSPRVHVAALRTGVRAQARGRRRGRHGDHRRRGQAAEDRKRPEGDRWHLAGPRVFFQGLEDTRGADAPGHGPPHGGARGGPDGAPDHAHDAPRRALPRGDPGAARGALGRVRHAA